MKPLAEYKYNDFGGSPVAEHNFPCPICQEEPAVVHMWNHTFNPCRKCGNYWKTINLNSWFKRFVYKFIFAYWWEK